VPRRDAIGRRSLRRALFATALAVGILGCRPETETPVADVLNTPAARNATAASESDQNREAEPAPELDERIALATPEPQTEAIDPEASGAVAPCVICHGASGEGNPALDAPRIGGLDAKYLARQLQNFRTSVRGGSDADKHGTTMRAIAITFDDDEVVADLATYFSQLQPPYAEETTVSGNVERGAEIYAVCTACHGMDARGSEELHTPSLVGQYDWYLVRQLESFKSGLRGRHPLDVSGQQMTPIVLAGLPQPDDIANVVAYIRSLPTHGLTAGAQ
jgi:cytochrome c553